MSSELIQGIFNLHTWVFLSCVLTSSGYKCLLVVYAFFLWESSCHKYFLVSHDVSIYCMLDLLDPYGRYYELPLRSRYRILDIILLLGYFFIARRFCINDVSQQCHINALCLRPLSFFGSLVILFSILDYSSSTVLFIFFWISFFRYGVFDPGIFRFLFWTVVTLFFGMIYKSSSFAWL